MTMYSPQKLHPISYIDSLISVIKSNFIVIIIFLFNIKDFKYDDFSSYIIPGIMTLIFSIGFIHNIIKVYNTRYWIEEDHFILTTGVFNKERKELNISRIQSADTSQGLINQIVGGVELIIKTPSDGIELGTISKKQSEVIEQELQSIQERMNNQVNQEAKELNDENHTETHQQHAKPQYAIFKMPFKQLLFMSMTSGAIALAFVTLSPIIGSLSSVIPWDKFGEEISSVFKTIYFIVIFIVILVLLLSYIIGTVMYLIKFYGYRVIQENHQLKIQYGLFTKKNITVPTDRLQGVLEHQSFIRKLFGYTSIHFYITSDIDATEGEPTDNDGRIMILPFIPRKEAYKVIRPLVPEMTFNHAKIGMPLKGFHRHFLILSLCLIGMGIIGWYMWSLWSLIIALLPISLFFVYAILYTRFSGFSFSESELVVQKASILNIKRFYVKKEKVLGMAISQHPFLERSQLANFQFVIAKGSSKQNIGLKFSEVDNVLKLKNWYMKGDTHEVL